MANDAIGSGESRDDRPDEVVSEQAESAEAPAYFDPADGTDATQHETDKHAGSDNLDEFEPTRPNDQADDEDSEAAAGYRILVQRTGESAVSETVEVAEPAVTADAAQQPRPPDGPAAT